MNVARSIATAMMVIGLPVYAAAAMPASPASASTDAVPQAPAAAGNNRGRSSPSTGFAPRCSNTARKRTGTHELVLRMPDQVELQQYVNIDYFQLDLAKSHGNGHSK